MLLHPRPIDPIPEATARVARQAFLKGNRYILLRDELGPTYTDTEFAPLWIYRRDRDIRRFLVHVVDANGLQ